MACLSTGAIAAKIAHPEHTALTITDDAGFLMNCQEIETALRIGTPIIILIWSDSEYGLITWHQLRHFGRPAFIEFNNPDFVKFADSFGARGYRVESADELAPVLILPCVLAKVSLTHLLELGALLVSQTGLLHEVLHEAFEHLATQRLACR